MKQSFKSIFILVTLLLFIFLYLGNISFMMKALLEYTDLFLTKLFPVSFPFFILSSLLIDYQIVQYLPIHSYSFLVFFLSFISGFPSGAKYTKDLFDQKKISFQEGCHILTFSHFPNPFFVLGTVHIILKDYSLSLKILLSIMIGNFILFLFSKKTTFKKENIIINIDFSNSLRKAIYSSSKTIVLIYGVSLFFYLISVLILKVLPLPIPYSVLLMGFFDLTKGVFATSLIHSVIIRSYLILLFISFGPLSIQLQTKSILADTPYFYHYYLKGRILGTILSLLIFTLLLLF